MYCFLLNKHCIGLSRRQCLGHWHWHWPWHWHTHPPMLVKRKWEYCNIGFLLPGSILFYYHTFYIVWFWRSEPMSGLSVYLLIQLVKDETILAFFARLSWQLVVRFSDLVLAPARRHSPGHWWGQPRTLTALALSAALDIVKSNTKKGAFSYVISYLQKIYYK